MTTCLNRYLILLVIVISVFACTQDPAQSEIGHQSKLVNKIDNEKLQVHDYDKLNTSLIKKRDWNDIMQSGVIRALRLEWEEEHSLPRSGSTSLFHIDLFNRFATTHNLKVSWIKVKSLNQMFQYLEQHKADVIPRHLTITVRRLKKMSFSLPISQDQEILIAEKGTRLPFVKSKIEIAVPESSAYAEALNKSYPYWKITTFNGSLNSDEIADQLIAKKIKYSVLDGQSVDNLLSYRDDIVALKKFSNIKDLAWAVSKNNIVLLNKLNEFIAHHHVIKNSRKDRKYDLETIKRKNYPIRMITRNSPETYFLWRGELMGFEYELMRKFAQTHNLRLEVIVADNYKEMKQLLEQGKGDIIAGGISRIDERKSDLQFSIRYNRVSELLVSNKSSQPINSFEDLNGRSLSIRKSSAFWPQAKLLENKYGVKIIVAEENVSTELLIEKVAKKEIDLTIADSNLVGIEKRFRQNIITPLTLKNNVPYAYGVRDKNPQLRYALNSFIKKTYRGTFYNVLKSKYFSNGKRLKGYRENRITLDSELSPYDQLVKENARKYDFDWRLITSQMFQESRFDPLSKSAAGAQGLMQVLPRTANELGYYDLSQPEQSIAAGVQYLDWTRARFSSQVDLQEKILFALAAYNAGFGHVKDAQKLAKSINLDPHKWFGNVEKAMLLLQQPEYYKKTRFGYCRGSEPVNYVREIQQRYLSYVDIAY
jgi:membrane-bound lytic murein transglycosylase F